MVGAVEDFLATDFVLFSVFLTASGDPDAFFLSVAGAVATLIFGILDGTLFTFFFNFSALFAIPIAVSSTTFFAATASLVDGTAIFSPITGLTTTTAGLYPTSIVTSGLNLEVKLSTEGGAESRA